MLSRISVKHVNYENYTQIKDMVYEFRRNILKEKIRANQWKRFIKSLVLNRYDENFSLFSQLLKNNSNLEIRNLLQKMIIDSYFQNSFEKNDNERNLSNSEFLKQIIHSDNAVYLHNLISFNNVNLKNDSFESMLVNYKEYMKQNEDESNNLVNDDKCKIEIVIAKKYSDEEQLQNDNM